MYWISNLIEACYLIADTDLTSIDPVIIYKYLIITLAGFWVCAFFSNRVYFKILYVLIALITALRENIIHEPETPRQSLGTSEVILKDV